MNIVKKLSIVFIMVILTICISTNKTYAALNCNVNLSTPKNKVTYEEQFSVDVAISNLQTTNGIIAIGAIVSYDTESLTLVSIEGQNNWSNPFHNTSNGKITSFKNELSTKNENVFQITFKVNEKGKAKNSAWVKISDFEISDGEGEKNCGESSINITIEDKKNTNTGNNNQGSNNTQKPNSKPGNSNQSSGNTQTSKPSTGETKPTGNSSKNETTVENVNTNNVDTNNIENVVGEDSTNSENETNNVQNIFEDNAEESRENKTMSKWLFYTISGIAVSVIIVMLFVIAKYRRTK